ncbi:MAG TPA: hypothetical protein VHE53_05225 [Patescibacteria group bacterium]|nr:hypothetical protein [Patescibacteria group bacterium]
MRERLGDTFEIQFGLLFKARQYREADMFVVCNPGDDYFTAFALTKTEDGRDRLALPGGHDDSFILEPLDIWPKEKVIELYGRNFPNGLTQAMLDDIEEYIKIPPRRIKRV